MLPLPLPHPLLSPCRHTAELAKWEALVAQARSEQAAAQRAASDAARAQALAEASRASLADLERALDAREAKLGDSWKAFRAQLAAADGGAGALLHSDQRLKVGLVPWVREGGWLAPAACSEPRPVRCHCPLRSFFFPGPLPLQDDAQAAAVEASGRSPSPLPPINGSSGAASADLVRVLHQRRTQLVERETALQRWAVALELEAGRQATAAAQLRSQEGRVALLAAESNDSKQAAQALLADVQQREVALQREAAELQAAAAAAQRERQEVSTERQGLEAAATDLAARAADIGRREQQLGATEEQWAAKVAQAEAQLKVRLCEGVG